MFVRGIASDVGAVPGVRTSGARLEAAVRWVGTIKGVARGGGGH